MHRKRGGVAFPALGSIVAGATAILAADRVSAEPFSYPHFDWIEPGAMRPIPHVAETTAACWETPTDACLRHAWRARMRQYRERELAAPAPGWHSYRVILDRSFFAPVSIRLDVDPSGAGRLTTHWLDRSRAVARGSSLIRRPARFSTRQPPVTAVSKEEVAAFEAALNAHGFDTIEADPEPEVVCSDGTSIVIEAVVDGRYRYVSRACSITNPAVARLGRTLIDLAKHKQPDERFNPEE